MIDRIWLKATKAPHTRIDFVSFVALRRQRTRAWEMSPLPVQERFAGADDFKQRA
jgi:hypothetical protein